jgi:hypothetical protein
VFLVLALHAEFGDTRIHGAGLGASDAHALVATTLIEDFYYYRCIASLLYDRSSSTADCFDARFRIYIHHNKDMRIEQFLQLPGVALLARLKKLISYFLRKWRTEIFQCGDKALYVGGQRLRFNVNGIFRRAPRFPLASRM